MFSWIAPNKSHFYLGDLYANSPATATNGKLWQSHDKFL